VANVFRGWVQVKRRTLTAIVTAFSLGLLAGCAGGRPTSLIRLPPAPLAAEAQQPAKAGAIPLLLPDGPVTFAPVLGKAA
jgi:uncharacterized lipoprotein YajG